MRYRVRLPVKLGGRKIRVLFNLSDRSRNNFKVLIGRRTVVGKFLVDVSRAAVKYPKNPKTKGLVEKMMKDPYRFHKKYVKKSSGKAKSDVGATKSKKLTGTNYKLDRRNKSDDDKS